MVYGSVSVEDRFIGYSSICLCGSTRFLAEFIHYNAQLTRAGHIVYSIGCVLKDKDNNMLAEQVDSVHKDKITRSSAVLVLDVNGYIGSSTKKEIEYAQTYSTDVFYLSELNGGHPPAPMDLGDVLAEDLCIETYGSWRFER